MIYTLKLNAQSISFSFVRSGGFMVFMTLLMTVVSCGETYDVEQITADDKQPAEAVYYMVSAAHPLAAEAGREVLRSGGNAVDAAVAVQMVLNVVEPPESGIGGGAFMLYRDGVTGEMSVYDGREKAPAAATENRFLVSGRPLPLWAAIPTGLAVGVPGTLAMLHQAHSELGSLSWGELFEPAAALAEEGIPMPERLQRQIDYDPSLWIFRDTRNHFMLQRRADPPQLRNPELARTFRLIASDGPDAFYAGPLTTPIIDAASGRWPGRSDLTHQDFLDYTPVKRNVICSNYRGRIVCGIPPPSSGGVAILQILGILEHFPLHEMNPGDPVALHLIAEASRLAFSDRARYIGDPAFVEVPTEELVDSAYLAGRAALINPKTAMEHVNPGYGTSNSWYSTAHFKNDTPLHYEQETTGTSHFSIVDAAGNMVSMTTSIESPFGSRMMVNGFLLNNQLTDFTFQPDQNGFYSPNAVAPGKRPRSSMSPVMVSDDEGEVTLIIGSRGGSRIIGYVVKTLIGVLDWGLPLQEAIALPNLLHRGTELEIEMGTTWADLADTLSEMGHNVRVLPLESGVHGIERVNGHYETGNKHLEKNQHQDGEYHEREGQLRWRGGADPRMEGAARGD